MPTTYVDLAEEGLQQGALIDGFLQTYWDNGVMLRIPQGRYAWNGGGLGGRYTDAYLIGDGPVVLDAPDRPFSSELIAPADTTLLMNITLLGKNERAAGGSFDISVPSGAPTDALVLDNFNMPDGSVAGTTRGLRVRNDHRGQFTIRNAYIGGFASGGLDASAPGAPANKDAANGPVHVEGGLYRNNNEWGIRLGSDKSSARYATIVADGHIPLNANGQSRLRGVGVTEPIQDAFIEHCHITFTQDANPTSSSNSGCVYLDPGTRDSEGLVQRNIIRNDLNSNPAMLFTTQATDSGPAAYAVSEYGQRPYGSAGVNWRGNNNQISGFGNLRTPGIPSWWVSCNDGTVPFSCQRPRRNTGSLPWDRFIIIPVPGRVPDSGFTYRFRATGAIEHVLNVGELNSDPPSDIITAESDGTYTVEGFVQPGVGDSFQINGEIFEWEITSEHNVPDEDLFLFFRNVRRSQESLNQKPGSEIDFGDLSRANAHPRMGTAIGEGAIARDNGRLTRAFAESIGPAIDEGGLTAAVARPNHRGAPVGVLGDGMIGTGEIGSPVSQAIEPKARLTKARGRGLTATEVGKTAVTVSAGEESVGAGFAPRGRGPIAQDTDVVEPVLAVAELVEPDIIAATTDEGSLTHRQAKPRRGHTVDLWWDDFIDWDPAESIFTDFETAPGEPRLAAGVDDGTLHFHDKKPVVRGPFEATVPAAEAETVPGTIVGNPSPVSINPTAKARPVQVDLQAEGEGTILLSASQPRAATRPQPYALAAFRGSFGDADNIKVVTRASVPTGAKIDAVVYEDRNQDGEPENGRPISIPDGKHVQTVTGFQARDQNDYWPLFYMARDGSEAPEIFALSISIAE